MSEKVSSNRKVIVAVVLFIILVVLPAGSWFYLRGGLNWRKSTQAEMQHYGKIRSATVIYPDGTKENMLKDKVCVLFFFGQNPELTPVNRHVLEIGEKLVKQFGYKPGVNEDPFRMVMISEGGTAEFKTMAQTLPTADLANWVWTGGLGSWNTILANAYDLYCQKNDERPSDAYFALADNSGSIRCFYDARDDEAINHMVAHIALLMPPK